jgi:CRP/FNR family transcriptional regulator, cyclic AMP receptor protein
MADSKIQHLRRVPLFSALPGKQLAFVASRVDEVHVPAGRTLVEQGAGNHSLHIIAEGEVEVTVDGRRRRSMGAGEYFGEISMLDRCPATATVTATSPVHLLVLSHGQFRDAVKADPELTMAILATIAERLRADATARGEAHQPL